MDILDENSGINLSDPEWKIYARNVGQPPHYIGKDATVKGSIISEGGIVDGTVTKSIIFQKVSIGQGAVIENSVIFPGTVVGDGAVVKYSIVGQNTVIGAGATVGGEFVDEDSITVIGADVTVEAGGKVDRGAMIEGGVL